MKLSSAYVLLLALISAPRTALGEGFLRGGKNGENDNADVQGGQKLPGPNLAPADRRGRPGRADRFGRPGRFGRFGPHRGD